MRLGIVKLSALGDVIVAMSFLPILKEMGYEVDWFIDSRFAPIAESSPCIHKLHILEVKNSVKNRNFSRIFSQIKGLRALQRYDLVVDMQGLLKSAFVARCIPSSRIRGFSFTSCKESCASFMYQETVRIAYQEHILVRNAVVLGLNPLLNMPSGNAFGFTHQAYKKIASLLGSSQNKKVLLVLEASRPEKMYPISKFIQLCKSLQSENIQFFTLCHAHPYLSEELCMHADVSLLPLLNLDEVKALIMQIDVVIGGDTGITHLAWAMQRASITLYGNTPLERFALHGIRNIALSGNMNAAYQKDDFSIAKIEPEEIKHHLLELL